MLKVSRAGSGALDDLLTGARRDGAEFPVFLANHLPMALVALDRLGADGDRLRAFDAAYRASNPLVPLPAPVAPIAGRAWDAALGDRAREADYRAFFGTEVRRLGIRGAVAAFLPALAPGVGASALHALMRLAYGLMRTDPDEVAAALGAWAATFLALPRPTGAPPATDDPAAVLAEVADIAAVRRVVPRSDLLWHNVEAVAWAPGFAPVVDRLRIGRDTPARVAAASLALFAGTLDFAALHALAGSHWVRLVLPFCPVPDLLLRSFWQVIAALVPKIGCPALPDAATLDAWRRLPCPDWAAIAAAAAASDDEHDISLVFSAREEEAVYGDALYRVVAARRMGLIA